MYRERSGSFIFFSDCFLSSTWLHSPERGVYSTATAQQHEKGPSILPAGRISRAIDGNTFCIHAISHCYLFYTVSVLPTQREFIVYAFVHNRPIYNNHPSHSNLPEIRIITQYTMILSCFIYLYTRVYTHIFFI